MLEDFSGVRWYLPPPQRAAGVRVISEPSLPGVTLVLPGLELTETSVGVGGQSSQCSGNQTGAWSVPSTYPTGHLVGGGLHPAFLFGMGIWGFRTEARKRLRGGVEA